MTFLNEIKMLVFLFIYIFLCLKWNIDIKLHDSLWKLKMSWNRVKTYLSNKEAAITIPRKPYIKRGKPNNYFAREIHRDLNYLPTLQELDENLSFECDDLIGLDKQISTTMKMVLCHMINEMKGYLADSSLLYDLLPLGIILEGPKYGINTLVRTLTVQLSYILGYEVLLFQIRTEDLFEFKTEADREILIKKLFKDVDKCCSDEQKCIVFIEDLERLCNHPCLENSYVSQLIAGTMEELKGENVVVMASVRDVSNLDPALQACFGKNVKFPDPREFSNDTRRKFVELATSSWKNKPSNDILNAILGSEVVIEFNADMFKSLAARVFKLAMDKVVEAEVECCKNYANLKFDQDVMDKVDPSLDDWLQVLNSKNSWTKSDSKNDVDEEETSDDRDESKTKGDDTDSDTVSDSDDEVNSDDEKRLISKGFNLVGGLEEQIQELKEKILFPLENRDQITELALKLPYAKSVLLQGPTDNRSKTEISSTDESYATASKQDQLMTTSSQFVAAVVGTANEDINLDPHTLYSNGINESDDDELVFVQAADCDS